MSIVDLFFFVPRNYTDVYLEELFYVLIIKQKKMKSYKGKMSIVIFLNNCNLTTTNTKTRTRVTIGALTFSTWTKETAFSTTSIVVAQAFTPIITNMTVGSTSVTIFRIIRLTDHSWHQTQKAKLLSIESNAFLGPYFDQNLPEMVNTMRSAKITVRAGCIFLFIDRKIKIYSNRVQ